MAPLPEDDSGRRVEHEGAAEIKVNEFSEHASDQNQRSRTRCNIGAALFFIMSPILFMIGVTTVGLLRFMFAYQPVDSDIMDRLLFQQSFLDIGWPSALLLSFFGLLIYLFVRVSRR